MSKTNLILSILVFVVSSCGQRSNQQANTAGDEVVFLVEADSLNSAEIDLTTTFDFKVLELDFGFKVTAKLMEDFGHLKTYSNVRLERNNTIIYFDDSLNEYEFCNHLFPIVLQTGDDSFELLFEMNGRPFRNYLKRLFISNNEVVGQDRLPVFEGKPIDINNDGIKVFAGFWDDFEIWGENNNLTSYIPILYFSVTETGLKLDSALTKKRNEMIYGRFYGFSNSVEYKIPASVIEKFEQELRLIRGER